MPETRLIKSVFLTLAIVLMFAGPVFCHTVSGPEADQHNTVYSYQISEVALDELGKKLHVAMQVHMCPFCSPYNNYVQVTVAGIGTKTTYNTPVGETCTRSFEFDTPDLQVGDFVNINSDVWCEWCGHWYDSKTYKVETKVIENEGLGSQCAFTLVPVGSTVNVSPGLKMP